MENLKVKAVVLEDKSGSFVGENGASISYVQMLAQVGGRVIKFKCDKSLVVKPFVESQVELELSIQPGKDLLADLRVVGIEEA